MFLKSATPHPKRARPSVPQMFGIPTYLYGFADGLMKWLPAVQNTACRTSDHRCSTARPHYIACSPAVALASSPPTSSVQAGRASVQIAAWASPTVLDVDINSLPLPVAVNGKYRKAQTATNNDRECANVNYTESASAEAQFHSSLVLSSQQSQTVKNCTHLRYALTGACIVHRC